LVLVGEGLQVKILGNFNLAYILAFQDCSTLVCKSYEKNHRNALATPTSLI